MGVIFEEDRNINLLVRKYVYRSLLAFVGRPAEDDTYHQTLTGGFSFKNRECTPLQWPDPLCKSASIYPSDIGFASDPDHDATGGVYCFNMDFAVTVDAAKKLKESDETDFIEGMLGYLNTFFHSYPSCEGVFDIITDYSSEYLELENKNKGGKLNMRGIVRRQYTVNRYTT